MGQCIKFLKISDLSCEKLILEFKKGVFFSFFGGVLFFFKVYVVSFVKHIDVLVLKVFFGCLLYMIGYSFFRVVHMYWKNGVVFQRVF